MTTIQVPSKSRANLTHTLYIHNGKAVGCDCEYREHRTWTACPHMTLFETEVLRAEKFAALMRQYDVRSRVDIEAKRAAYWNYELSIGA